MNIIVTGNDGFIGRHLHNRLCELGHTVLGLDKKVGTSTANFFKMWDIVKENMPKPDTIVHLGANCSSQISLRNPSLDFNDNAVGTFNVCELSRLLGGVPIIFNSTMKVYPGEDGLLSPYGQSKLVGEQYLKLYQSLYDVSYVINRPSSVFGPKQDGSDDGGWLTWFIKASLQNKTINLYGDGTQSRDMLYIDDCIDLLVEEIEQFEKFKNNDFDFGGGVENEVSLNEVLEVLNYHNIEYKPKLKGDVQRFVCDNQKISTVTDWKPKVSWLIGLEKTKEYFSKHP